MTDALAILKEMQQDADRCGYANATIKVPVHQIDIFVAEIKRLRVENAVLKEEYAEAVSDYRKEAFLDAAKMAEAEPMPAGLSPFSFKDYSVEDVAIATVAATRKNIAAALRRAAEGVKMSEREEKGISEKTFAQVKALYPSYAELYEAFVEKLDCLRQSHAENKRLRAEKQAMIRAADVGLKTDDCIQLRNLIVTRIRRAAEGVKSE